MEDYFCSLSKNLNSNMISLAYGLFESILLVLKHMTDLFGYLFYFGFLSNCFEGVNCGPYYFDIAEDCFMDQ